MAREFGPRRGTWIDVGREMRGTQPPLGGGEPALFEDFDLVYRSLCALMYNYVPMSGHPGGSISSGRIVAALLFDTMAYDASKPERDDADILSYAAGHKALGLYAMWALRDEVARLGDRGILPDDPRRRFRLEDLLGFRRNPVAGTPLFRRFHARPLDGHPTPATPFVRLSTGASGVGLASSLGLAFAARDYFGEKAPRIHILEGEGGLTPGRVGESLAAAGTASLDNAVLHIDWNQASIDSDQVCRDGSAPGDYVQWTPMELAYLHDWNVVYVPDGKDFQQVLFAQRAAQRIANAQPTAVVYRTVKGWKYGMEGRISHGAGHKLCSEGFREALAPLLGEAASRLPTCCDLEELRCAGEGGAGVMEECYWTALGLIREHLEGRRDLIDCLCSRLEGARQRLDGLGRKPRPAAPSVEAIYEMAAAEGGTIPGDLRLEPGSSTTLRAELGRVLNRYNRASRGAILVAAADLLGSTSVNAVAEGFPGGYYNTASNPGGRILSIGGICEDAIAGIMSGLGSFGRHVGVGSSYGAFLAPLGHIASRLHGIGNQARQQLDPGPYRPMVLVCAHAGLKTGEDGPTHADPQALQLLQGNFPPGVAITLTPWDPAEIWPLVSAALAARPALLFPFVTRPKEIVPDREALGLAPATEAARGLYALRTPAAKGGGGGDGTVVLQGSGVAMDFTRIALPRLLERGIDLHVYYVASAELFTRLSRREQERIYPEERAREAIGITGFTLPTLYRWVTSERGRSRSLHPFRKGHYLGSGQADLVLAEAGLDGEAQVEAILRYLG